MSVTKRYFSVLYNVKTVFEKPAFGLDWFRPFIENCINPNKKQSCIEKRIKAALF